MKHQEKPAPKKTITPNNVRLSARTTNNNTREAIDYNFVPINIINDYSSRDCSAYSSSSCDCICD